MQDAEILNNSHFSKVFMKSRLFTLMSFLVLALVGQAVFAADDFVQQGDTIFVRPGKRPYGWTNPLNIALRKSVDTHDIKTVVFVNMGKVGRWERVGGEGFVQPYLRNGGVTTIVVGACENYCAAMFSGGTRRLLAEGAYLDIKTPIDSETKQLEPRFPNSQFAVYERQIATPAVRPYKDIFYEAFTKGGMTGGTRFYAEKVQFCEARDPDQGCKLYEGMDAATIGLITDTTPAVVTLPEGW